VASDEDLAGRVRGLISAEVGVTERPMFGGVAFLVDGRMAIAVKRRGRLMVRVDPSQVARAH
jgi:TfoX/Sxy family transcriptional regulator of competence genes